MNSGNKNKKPCRISIAVSEEQMKQLDALVQSAEGETRSGYVGRLISDAWTTHAANDSSKPVVATITMIYDHHSYMLQTRLTKIQHDAPAKIMSVLHIHLNHHHCMEVLAVKGRARDIQTLAARLTAVKGIIRCQYSILDALK